MNHRRTTPHGRRANAFTLLEMILVVSLTAVLLGFALMMLNDANKVWSMQQGQSRSARQAWRLAAKISDELRAAVVPSKVGEGAVFQGEDGVTNLLAEIPDDLELAEAEREYCESQPLHLDVIRFPSARVAPLRGRERPGMVEYRLKRDEAGRLAGVERRCAIAGQTLDEGIASTLSTQTWSLSFEYLNADDAWVPAWSETAALPRAVRVEVGNNVALTSRMPIILRYLTTVNLPTGARIPK